MKVYPYCLFLVMLFVSTAAHTQPSTSSPMSETGEEVYRTCYTVDKFAYRIFRDKYRNIPIEQSSFYQLDASYMTPQMSGLLTAMTNVIYELPFESEPEARQKQAENMTNVAILGCLMGLSL